MENSLLLYRVKSSQVCRRCRQIPQKKSNLSGEMEGLVALPVGANVSPADGSAIHPADALGACLLIVQLA